jgi:hypothetical protein
MQTAREIADQVRALSRIAEAIRGGARCCNLDASWIEAAAKTLGDVALAQRAKETK